MKIFVGIIYAALGLLIWFFICAVTQSNSIVPILRIVLGLALVIVGAVNVWKRVFVPFGRWPALGLAVALLWLYVVGSYHLWLDLLLLAVSFVTPLLVLKEARDWVMGNLPRLLAATTLYERYQIIRSLSLGTAETEEFRPLSGGEGLRICAVFLLSFWLLSSLGNAWSLGGTLPTKPGRFAERREQSPYKAKRVGLALSGGGYRAVLMHAGVLDALERLGVPVTNISTVSGGSIIGAFYAIGGTPGEMRRALMSGRFHLTRSLTDAQNLSRLGFPFRVPGTEIKLFKWYDFSRSDVQASLLDKVLLGGATLGEMDGAPAAGAPELMVCATDLRSGALYGFHRRGLLRKYVEHPSDKPIFRGLTDAEIERLPDAFLVNGNQGSMIALGTTGAYVVTERPGEGGPRHVQLTRPTPRAPLTVRLSPAGEWLDIPLARVVAASGAFPGAFNAIGEELTVKSEGGKDEGLDLLLADGGITDNSAVSIMEHARQNRLEGWDDLSLVLSSDASALLSEAESLTALGELTRAVDIVYAHVGSTTWDSNLPKVLLSPGAVLDTRVLSTTLSDKERRDLLDEQVSRMVDRSMTKLDGEALRLLSDAAADVPTKDSLNELRGKVAYGIDPGLLGRTQGNVVREFVDCSEVFLRTSTLTDHFDDEDAAKLYRLGQFLVALNWPYIKHQLGGGTPAQGDAAGR
ncbi:MAG TPA: patatin-like phospholipase family protein [Pyrinomonadaceae bacterium]|nr:patatin-like phospholipase family protein [Pyrinomonadaceae bacterium]